MAFFNERIRPYLASSRGAFGVLDDDTVLLGAARAGDRAALGVLLTRHESALLRLCHGMLGGIAGAHAGAEDADAVQETFLRALRAFMSPNGFRGDCSVRTYLYRIAVNVCLEWRRRPQPQSLSSTAAFYETKAEGPTPEDVAVDRARIAEALRELQPRQRLLLLLREQEGWSAGEIADVLGWNEKRVHNELFKMRQRLLRWRQDEMSGERA